MLKVDVGHLHNAQSCCSKPKLTIISDLHCQQLMLSPWSKLLLFEVWKKTVITACVLLILDAIVGLLIWFVILLDKANKA